MIYLLFIIIAINFLIGYIKFNPKANAVTIFTIGFLLASFVCLFYIEEWNLNEFHFNTFILLAVGISSFTLTCCYVDRIKKRKYPITKLNRSTFEIKPIFLVISLLINLLVQLWYYRFSLSYSGGSNIAEALVEINIDTNSKGYEFQIPFMLRNLRMFFDAFTFYVLVICANLIVEKQYKKLLLPGLFCFVSFMGGFMSSSRSGSINYLVFLFICYSIILLKKRNKKTRMTPKRIVIYVLLGLSGVSLFVKSTEWIGREIGDYGALYYLSFYCGAEIKNIDTFVNEKHKESPAIGCYTFHNFYSDEFKRKYTEKLTIFRNEGDYTLGNVYTCFQKLYQDFGFWGSVVMLSVMAFIMQLIFMRALNSTSLNTKLFDFNTFLFAYMSTHLIMSFFSERFYNAFNQGTLKIIIEAALISYIAEKYFKIPYCSKKVITVKD